MTSRSCGVRHKRSGGNTAIRDELYARGSGILQRPQMSQTLQEMLAFMLAVV